MIKTDGIKIESFHFGQEIKLSEGFKRILKTLEKIHEKKFG